MSKKMADPKQCKFCLEHKPRTDFRSFKGRPNALYSVCGKCEAPSAKAWREKNKEKLVLINRKARLKATWGLTPQSFADMLAGQDGGCAICKDKVPGGKGTFKVDHCHKTGVIRGLLCNFCNVGLGQFRDSPDLLKSAISYLKK